MVLPTSVIQNSSQQLLMQIFTRRTDAYSKMLINDYLHHKALYRAATNVLRACPPGLLFNHVWTAQCHHISTVSLLDLGCGDASVLPLLLPPPLASTITCYHGVDASPQQLAAAGPNLHSLLGYSSNNAPSIKLTEADIRAFVRTPNPTPYDTVLASFVIHHLPSAADKAALLTDVRRLLAPGGTFVLIDVVRRDTETRDEWVRRIVNTIRREWLAMSPEEREESIDHVTSSDYPESWQTLRAAAEQAGYESVQLVELDDTEMFATIVFRN